MSGKIYLRPVGMLYGRTAHDAASAGKAGLLAGGPIAFTMLEVIDGTPGKTRKQFRSFVELQASGEPAFGEILKCLTEARAPLAGLALDSPRIMGVVNVTPDSFSDGGLHAGPDEAIAHGIGLSREGADILDIGGESTRPGSDPVSEQVEAARVLPVIEGLKDAGPLISVDTRKSAIMKTAGEAGADMLNDVSALTHDPDSLKVAALSGLPVVLMHALGDPKTMQDDPVYADVLLEVFDFLAARIAACEAAGIDRSRIIADPGIGFGKTLEHNLALLQELSLFHGLGVGLMIGASRKRFIGTLAEEPDPKKREPGSLAVALASIAQGVQLVRVHDVAAMRQALTIWSAVNC